MSEASRVDRLLSKENNPHLGCIKLPIGVYAGSMEESMGHLMDVYFPVSRGPFGDSGERPELERGYKPREWSLAAKVVFPSRVEWAIKIFEI